MSFFPFTIAVPLALSLSLARQGRRFACSRHQVGFIAVKFAFHRAMRHVSCKASCRQALVLQDTASNLPVAFRLLLLILLAHHELKLRQVNLVLGRRGTVALLRLAIRPPKYRILQRSITSFTALAHV